MCYLRFDKTQMTNLQDSLFKELLITNESGAYCSTTLVGCNIRKYHGLLVVPVPNLDDENHVLLSSLDETVIQHGAEFNLGLHKYQGENYSPKGHKYIVSFEWDKVPTWIYRIGGVLLKKEIVYRTDRFRLFVRYTLLEAHSDTTLRLKPFLAFRSVRQWTHENGAANTGYTPVKNGIKMCMYEGYPDLYMQTTAKSEFHYEPNWYRGMDYPKERERGYDATEDLLVPGYFEMPIKKGESIIFTASLKEKDPKMYAPIMEAEIESLDRRDSFYHCLVNAAHQFHVQKENEEYILAGYPWFKCRARDTFISLPGLTLSIEEEDYFELVMETAMRALYEFMAGKPLTAKIYEIDQPDVLLWCVWAVQQYAKHAGREKCNRKYGKLLYDVLHYIKDNRHPNLKLCENGLLYSEGKEKAVTWMNSTAGGRPVVPRTGYIVEFNALWYNALKFCASMAADFGDATEASDFEQMATLCGKSFVETFVNEYGYLFDYVEPKDNPDWSVRPNMIFAVALDYSPLTPAQQKAVLDVCTRELLTPKGLRSLSPKSGGYNPMYVGPQTQRDYAYHQGTAWPWLGGFYMEACLKIYKRTRLSFIERQMVGYEDEMVSHCIGTIPELFDGNPPFHGRGAISFAMNVAEILRTLELLEKYKY